MLDFALKGNLRGKRLGLYKKHTYRSSSSTVAFEHSEMHRYL
jgi:hypothetical protein